MRSRQADGGSEPCTDSAGRTGPGRVHSRSVVFFVAFQIYPPLAGNARRATEMILALGALGHKVLVVSPEHAWRIDGSIDQLQADFRESTGAELRLLETSDSLDRRLAAPAADDLYRSLGAETPDALRRWLERRDRVRLLSEVLEETDPDVVFMTYFDSDQYLDHRLASGRTTILDAVDLMSLNVELWTAIARELPPPPIDPIDLPERLFDLGFYDSLDASPWDREFRVYDDYDHVIAIVEEDAETIRRNASPARVTTIPVIHEPVDLDNRYDGDAFLPTGPNPFNLHGVLYFCRRVLPLVRRRDESFRLRLSGYCWDKLTPVKGLVTIEYANLEEEYRSACFLLCPVFGGTGQQVKIVEAMAHGVPVVAFRFAGERSPLRHGYSGLIADSNEEFADYVLALWSDRDLCRSLGAAARATVAESLTRKRLNRDLEALL